MSPIVDRVRKLIALAGSPNEHESLLKEGLAEVLDSPDVRTAQRRFATWHRWAAHSRLAPFRRLAATLGPLRENLIAYVATHLTNALSEGINLKIRAIARRSYGVPSPDNLIAMILLGCGGIDISPPHTAPICFH